MAEVTKSLASQEIRSSLTRLVQRLADLRASSAKPRVIRSRRQRARRPGWVSAGIVQVLVDQARPMRLMDIHRAIELQVGESVSMESVSWCLRMGVRGDNPRFVRVARGRYVVLNRSVSG